MKIQSRSATLYLFPLYVFFFLAGCEGSDGATGAVGPAGPPGPPGDPAPTPDPVAAAIDEANPEACATCHGGVGFAEHQSVYDKYVDGSRLELLIDDVSSAAEAGGTFTVTVEFRILEDGQPYVEDPGLPSLDQKTFYAVQYDSAAEQYLNGNKRLSNTDSNTNRFLNVVAGAAAGEYVLTKTGVPFAPESPSAPFDGAQVFGYIARTPLLAHEGGSGSELPSGSHVHLYDDVSNAAMAFGTAAAADPQSYESAANVSGCENCHGKPYLKHGYRNPVVSGLPDFGSCKSCHYDDRDGGHEDWQYQVDDPLNWATAGLPTAEVETRYAYKAKLMNDVHMAHAMEFPYPRSMANCSTCHAGKLDRVLDNSNFTFETCKSCHPVQGYNAWPEDAGNVKEGLYAQDERAPPLGYLWTEHGVEFHLDFADNPNANCTVCHKADIDGGIAPEFNELHTGYDVRIANEDGVKYRDLFTASIDDVAVDLDNYMMTISYSADASAITNAIADSLEVHVFVSFYGWDTKHFIVPSHERDMFGDSDAGGQRFEFDPARPDRTDRLFTGIAETAPGSWELVVDLAGWTDGSPGGIPALIADGTIRKAEITLASRLDVTGHDDEEIGANLNAVTRTVDLGASSFVNNYFKGTDAIVDVEKCEKCHDQLAVTWHTGRGRGGDIVACRNCHNPTFAGSHVEMASRSVENYVHAIHSFQDFDIDETFHDDAPQGDPAHGESFDPVLAKRYDQHIKHVFPNFTIRNCEACHVEGTYNVPDQTKSMPGLLSSSDEVDSWYRMVDTDTVVACDPCIPDEIAVLAEKRNIGEVPQYVVGPASRACGGCHRANLVKTDDAGGLAAFNAHTKAGGTLVENDEADNPPDDPDDEILFGIIRKIMNMFN